MAKSKKKKLAKQLFAAADDALERFHKATDKGDLKKATYYLAAAHAYSTAAGVASKGPKSWGTGNGDDA